MRRHRFNVWLPPLLLVVCGALSLLIYRELTLGPSTEAAAKGSTAVPTTLSALPPEPQFSMLPIEDFQAILERPIFSPGRRPPPVGSVELSATTGDVSFVLKGILIDADERTALFRSKRSDKLVRLGEGDKIEGWTLVRIEADQVILASGEIEKALELTFDPPTPTKRTRREKSSQNNKQQQGQEQVDQSNPAQVNTPE